MNMTNHPWSGAMREGWATAAQRRRRRILGSGGRSISTLLEPEAAAALQAIQSARGETVPQVLTRLLFAELKRTQRAARTR